MNKQRIALILSLFALGLAACGGDDDDESATTIPTVPLSVPGDETTLDGSTGHDGRHGAGHRHAGAHAHARPDSRPGASPRLAGQRHAAARRLRGGAVRELLYGEPGRLLGHRHRPARTSDAGRLRTA